MPTNSSAANPPADTSTKSTLKPETEVKITKSKVTAFVVIIFLSIGLIIALILTWRTLIFFNQRPNSKVASRYDNSYLFASPLSAKADGRESIRITVIVLDNQGKGIPNQTIKLQHSQVVSVLNSIPKTDETGKAYFDLTSVVADKYSITASTDQFPLPQTVSIIFE